MQIFQPSYPEFCLIFWIVYKSNCYSFLDVKRSLILHFCSTMTSITLLSLLFHWQCCKMRLFYYFAFSFRIRKNLLLIAKQPRCFMFKSAGGTLSAPPYIKSLITLSTLWTFSLIQSVLAWLQRSLEKLPIRTSKGFSLIIRIKVVPKGETLTPSIG